MNCAEFKFFAEVKKPNTDFSIKKEAARLGQLLSYYIVYGKIYTETRLMDYHFLSINFLV